MERFALGRTFHCTCGARVGRTLATGIPGAAEPHFLADSMLGRLARWLCTLGYDTAWEPEIADADLIRRGIEQRRIVLTRDRRIPEERRTDNVLLLGSDAPLEQLREVVTRFDLPWRERLFSRCTHCNRALESVDPETVTDVIPPAVQSSHANFVRCSGCARVFWQGSHTDRMRQALERALGG